MVWRGIFGDYNKMHRRMTNGAMLPGESSHRADEFSRKDDIFGCSFNFTNS